MIFAAWRLSTGYNLINITLYFHGILYTNSQYMAQHEMTIHTILQNKCIDIFIKSTLRCENIKVFEIWRSNSLKDTQGLKYELENVYIRPLVRFINCTSLTLLESLANLYLYHCTYFSHWIDISQFKKSQEIVLDINLQFRKCQYFKCAKRKYQRENTYNHHVKSIVCNLEGKKTN